MLQDMQDEHNKVVEVQLTESAEARTKIEEELKTKSSELEALSIELQTVKGEKLVRIESALRKLLPLHC